MKYIINRLKEPSTWSGLGMLAVSLGLGVPPGTLEAIASIGVGVAGLAAVLLREKTGA
jgi:hypothetical protein